VKYIKEKERDKGEKGVSWREGDVRGRETRESGRKDDLSPFINRGGHMSPYEWAMTKW
jgi:hypothetical protein